MRSSLRETPLKHTGHHESLGPGREAASAQPVGVPEAEVALGQPLCLLLTFGLLTTPPGTGWAWRRRLGRRCPGLSGRTLALHAWLSDRVRVKGAEGYSFAQLCWDVEPGVTKI